MRNIFIWPGDKKINDVTLDKKILTRNMKIQSDCLFDHSKEDIQPAFNHGTSSGRYLYARKMALL